jgi:hypothetical protein
MDGNPWIFFGRIKGIIIMDCILRRGVLLQMFTADCHLWKTASRKFWRTVILEIGTPRCHSLGIGMALVARTDKNISIENHEPVGGFVVPSFSSVVGVKRSYFVRGSY